MSIASISGVLATSALTAQDAGSGFSMRHIIDTLPTDPASIITLVIAAGAVGLVIWAGKGSGGGDKTG
jgi:hypothetical protein